jgi:gliding motility-associated-like protein
MKNIITLTFLFLGFFFFSAQAQQKSFNIGPAAESSDTVLNKLLIPNAFSPNGDGTNDIFKIANFTNQKLVEFKVFNRWGTILFTTEDPSSGWDGTFKGKDEPFGVYGYVIRIAYPQNIVETYKGTVTLLR